VLAGFSSGTERIRRTPGYRFTRTANAGNIGYMHVRSGIAGEEWCALARRALVALGFEDRE
jgi:hypothetical protein